jgi:hypothetical protein
MIEISNGRNCKECNKSTVCKYKDTVEAKIEDVKAFVEPMEIKKLPLSININCTEFSGRVNTLR